LRKKEVTVIPTNEQAKDTAGCERALYMAMDLGGSTWVLAFSDGRCATKARVRKVQAGDTEGLFLEIAQAKRRLGLEPVAPVRSCYEAGRDGFWLHRELVGNGVRNIVIDAASLEVSRQGRRAKTDRIDVRRALSALIRYYNGEPRVLAAVRIPSPEEEDRRRLSRERDRLTKERNRLFAGIRSRLALHGVRTKDIPRDYSVVRRPHDDQLPEHARRELERMTERLQVIERQLQVVEEELMAMLLAEPRLAPKVKALMSLRGIGKVGASVLVLEVFGWRQFRKTKEVGACVGLCPTPWRSDGIATEQGVSKRGNPRVRSLMVELAWLWLRWQKESQLSRWFAERFARGGGRARRVGIVALARRLLVDLWRYLEHGVVPGDALMTAPT
jgi:transposase